MRSLGFSPFSSAGDSFRRRKGEAWSKLSATGRAGVIGIRQLEERKKDLQEYLHDEAHNAFMTLPPYSRTKEGEAPQHWSETQRNTRPCRCHSQACCMIACWRA